MLQVSEHTSEHRALNSKQTIYTDDTAELMLDPDSDVSVNEQPDSGL